ANRVVIDAVDDRDYERNLDPDLREIFNRANLDVEQVADAPMLVLLFADAVELEIHVMLTRGLGGFTEFNVFGETNSVRGGENAIEADLFRVGDCVQVVRRQRRLST